MKPLKVVFAYRPRQMRMGGKMMRVDQLIEILRANLPEHQFTFETVRVPKAKQTQAFAEMLEQCRGAVVVFHKSAAVNLDAETRAALKKVAAGICIDHLDFVVAPMEPGFVDVHITASWEGKDEMERNLAGLLPGPDTIVRHLRHHADPRLAGTEGEALDRLVPGYFGAAVHVADTDAIPSNSIVPEYEPKDIDGFLKALPDSNFHLCVRNAEVGPRFGVKSTKPFTKGFNAAAVKANVLVNRQVHDAAYYLGDDYPFMIDGYSKEEVDRGLAKAREAFGSEEWKIGKERMAQMAAQVAPDQVAAEFSDIMGPFR